MRGFVVVAICACGGSVARAPSPSTTSARAKHVNEGVAIDPIAALAPADDQVSWLVPGPIQLELGGTPIPAPQSPEPIAVAMIEDHGSQIRVGVRLDHVRFAVWIERARLLSVMTRSERVRPYAGGGDFPSGDSEVMLKAGARVRRLAHKDGWTQLRYSGAVEINGWVPDSALADRGRQRDPMGRVPTGRTLQSKPGDIIRAEPRWAGRQLAVMSSFFLDLVQELEGSWREVIYEDGEVVVHGFIDEHAPPGRRHVGRREETGAPAPAPNVTSRSGTCLYATEGGDPLGYLVGDQQTYVEASTRAGWYAVTIDTPWGAMTFVAEGSSETDLVACAPPGAVPAPAGSQAPAPAQPSVP